MIPIVFVGMISDRFLHRQGSREGQIGLGPRDTKVQGWIDFFGIGKDLCPTDAVGEFLLDVGHDEAFHGMYEEQ